MLLSEGFYASFLPCRKVFLPKILTGVTVGLRWGHSGVTVMCMCHSGSLMMQSCSRYRKQSRRQRSVELQSWTVAPGSCWVGEPDQFELIYVTVICFILGLNGRIIRLFQTDELKFEPFGFFESHENEKL